MKKVSCSVAFVTHRFPPGPGGMERWNCQMAEAYGRAGADVCVFHFRNGREPFSSPHFTYAPVDVNPRLSPDRSPHFRYGIVNVARIVAGCFRVVPRLRRYRVWQVTFGEPLLLKVLIYAAAYLLGKTVVAACGCPTFESPYRPSLTAPVTRAVLRVLFRQSRLILVDGNDLRDELTVNGIDVRRVRVCYAGVDSSLFRPNPDRDALIRLLDGAGIRPVAECPIVLYCCRLSWENAPLDYVKTLNRVASRMAVQGIVVGDGPLRDEVAAAAKASACPIVLLGSAPYETLPVILSTIDVCLFTYAKSIGGISQMAPLAMACGAALVTTRVGDFGALVKSGYNGFLAAPGDVDECANLTCKLLTDTSLRASVGRNAAATIASGWTIESRDRMYADMLSEMTDV